MRRAESAAEKGCEKGFSHQRHSRRTSLAVAVVLAVGQVGLVGAEAFRGFCPGSGPGYCSDVVGAGDLRVRIDPNVASAAELEALPMIGPARAEKIIIHRETVSRRPAFRNAKDFDEVPDIGPGTIAELEPYLIFP